VSAPYPYVPHPQARPHVPVTSWRRYPVVLPIRGRRPPLWVPVVILVLFLAPGIYAWWRYGPAGDEPLVTLRHIGWIEVGVAVAVVAITVVFGWARSVGWVPRPRSALAVPLIAVALVATSVLLIGTAGFALSWRFSAYVILLVNFLAVGVFEETLFRGLLWAALPVRWSASRVLLVTSVCFGAVHVTNGFTTGNWGVAVAQACVVSFSGLGLGALRLRTGWLGLGVITHAFIDAGLAATTALLPELRGANPEHLAPALAVASLLFLALLGLYASLAVSGVVVLVRTFRAERQQRRWVALAGRVPGVDPWWTPPPPTLVA